MKTQRPINEVVAVRAGREGIELRAVANLAKEFDGLLRREAENVNRPVRWFDQAGQQFHQRGFAGAVWPYETGNARLEREIHFVNAENFSVKLGDVIKNDLAVVRHYPRTVSRARKRTFNMKSEKMQTKIIMIHAAGTGTSLRP